MNFSDRQWLWLAAGCYFLGLLWGTVAVLREHRQSRGTILGVMATGYLLQTWGLYLRGQATLGCPLGNLFELFQFTAWSATTLFFVVGTTFRLSMLGYFTASLTAALTLVSLSLPAWDATRNTTLMAGRPWVSLHAGLALFSYGVFALLALTSAMFLLRDHSLKSKRLCRWCTFLPSIRELDHIGGRLLTVGLGLLVAALAVGGMYWRLADAAVGHTKLLATVAVGVAYTILWAGRRRGRLTGRQLAWWSIGLFLLALTTLGIVDRSRHPVPLAPAEGRSEPRP